LPWRAERRFTELKSLVDSGELHGISTMRTLRVVKAGSDLYEQLYREIDICRFILGTEITEIFAIEGGEYTLNAIAATAAGYVCSLELSATLQSGQPNIDKHEIIAIGGVACDRAADTQVPQNSVYVYGEKAEPDTYTDVDAELYGLTPDECAIVRYAFDVAKNGTDHTGESEADLAVVDAAKRSVATTANIILGGEAK
ncbi:MAG: hypothetical protein IJD10_07030, partial [Clostridia bacterium]|nr:hypothetical protein [Clostridia bacterium]